MAKEYSGRRVVRLAKTVTQWIQDPDQTGPSAPLAGLANLRPPISARFSASLCVVSDKTAPSLDACPDLLVIGSAGPRSAEASEFANG